MAEGGDNSSDEEKNEEPSEQKLRKAQEEGNVSFSREILQLAVIIGGAVSVLYVLPYTSRYFIKGLTPFLGNADAFQIDPSSVTKLFTHAVKSMLMVIGFPMFILLVFAVVAGLAQKGKALSLKSIKPKLSNLSLKKGIQKIFSMKALVDFLKNVAKIIAFGVSLYIATSSYARYFDNWLWLTIPSFFRVFHDIAFTIFMTVILAFGAIALFDFFYQKYTFMKKMRMSKKEQKDEYKQSEGDPQIKGKIRQLRMERAQQRMMQDVPTATAVLMNPTHYAVAIKWEEETMNAPKVIAKGTDLVAFKIRDLAKEHKIPVIENPPLTRALFSTVELQEEIPPKFYKAVADVIRIVMRIKSQRFS